MLVEVKEKTEKKKDYHDKIKSGTNNLKLVPNQLDNKRKNVFSKKTIFWDR
jgi:hypothetical protein